MILMMNYDKWRCFINETKRKHAVKINPRSKYDRSATSLTQDLTAADDKIRAELRWNMSRVLSRLSSFIILNAATKSVINFINEQSEADKQRLIKDLQALSFMYDFKRNKTIFRPVTKKGGMVFYYDTYQVNSPVFRIQTILESLGAEKDITPDEGQLKDVYLYYVAPTNTNLWPDELLPKEPERQPNIFDDIFGKPEKKYDASKHFAGLNMSPDDLERLNRMNNLRNKKSDK